MRFKFVKTFYLANTIILSETDVKYKHFFCLMKYSNFNCPNLTKNIHIFLREDSDDVQNLRYILFPRMPSDHFGTFDIFNFQLVKNNN